MDLLVCLADTPGDVCTRDELLDQVWKGRAVSEGSLSTAVSELRRALGDDRNIVETIRKVGYRLTVAPEPIAPDPSASRSVRAKTIASGVTLAVAAAAASWLWWAHDSDSDEVGRDRDSYLASLRLAQRGEPNRRAIGLLRQVLDVRPTWSPAASELSHRLYLEAYDSADPERHLSESALAARAALAEDADHTPALRQLVVLETESGNLREASRLARAAIDRSPDDADARFALAYVYRYAGLLEEAARECELALLSRASPALRSCAIPLYRLGRFDRARAFLDLDYGSQWVLHQEALVRLHEGRRDDAARAFRRLPEDSPYNGLLESCRSAADDRLERVAATANEVADIEAGYAAALVLVACDRPDQALDALEGAIDAGYCAASIEREAPFAPLRTRRGWTRIVSKATRCRERFTHSPR